MEMCVVVVYPVTEWYIEKLVDSRQYAFNIDFAK